MALTARQKLIFLVMNISMPLFVLYYARNFPISLKLLVYLISLVLLNLTFFLAMRSKQARINKQQ